MKLKPLGEFLYTSCKDCKFAIYNEKTQTGCQADQIERFGKENVIEAYDDDEEFYVIKTICPYKVPKQETCTIKDVEKTADLVTFGIVLYLSHIKQNAGRIRKTIESICELEYDKTLFKVSMSHKHNVSAEEKKIVRDLMATLNENDIRTTTTLYASIEFAERDTFKSLKYADYVVKIKQGKKFDKQRLSMIKSDINNKVVRPILFSSPEADFVHTSFQLLDYELENFIMNDGTYVPTSIMFFLYWTILEYKTGQTVGKKMFNLKITNIQGKKPNLKEVIISSLGKSFILPIDVILGWVLTNEKRQRIFNKLGETLVVKIKESDNSTNIKYIKD